jgi:hypothetical protein
MLQARSSRYDESIVIGVPARPADDRRALQLEQPYRCDCDPSGNGLPCHYGQAPSPLSGSTLIANAAMSGTWAVLRSWKMCADAPSSGARSAPKSPTWMQTMASARQDFNGGKNALAYC